MDKKSFEDLSVEYHKLVTRLQSIYREEERVKREIYIILKQINDSIWREL